MTSLNYKQNIDFKKSANNRKGITLLLALILLSAILSISFSIATILFIEIRVSGDLTRTEASYSAANGVSEEAVFDLKRDVCSGADCSYITGFNNGVALSGTPIVSSTSSPVLMLLIPANSSKVLDFCSAVATSTGCGYGKVVVKYVQDTGSGDPVYAYLCEWDPYGSYANGPCSDFQSNTGGYWKSPDNGTLSYYGAGVELSAATNNTVTWTLDSSKQQELIIQNGGSHGAYLSVATYKDSSGTIPLGLPYIGSTSVTVNTVNATVGRRIQVIVPESHSSNQTAGVPGGSYSYSRTVTVAHGKVGNGTEDESNFTVLVCANGSSPCNTAVPGLSQSGSGAHVLNASGYDVVFSSTPCISPTLMQWEMEKYVASTGEMEAWVSVSNLSHTTDTAFYMCYGNSAVSTFQGGGAGSAWSNNYVGVWHLPDGTSLSAVNSVTGIAGTKNGPPAAITGKIDGAALFGGHTTDAIITDVSANNNKRTYSIWAYSTGHGGGNCGRLFDKYNTAAASENELLYDNTCGSTGYDFKRYWTTQYGVWDFSPPSANSWHYIVVAYDAGSTLNNPAIYVDGVSQAATRVTSPIGTPVSSTNSYIIGNSEKNSFGGNYAGTLDEFRIANTIRSLGWVKTEYNNQSSPVSFITFGPEQIP